MCTCVRVCALVCVCVCVHAPKFVLVHVCACARVLTAARDVKRESEEDIMKETKRNVL